ncbi:Flp pilus assembly protein TadD, contains TPR repeats [Variovorax sp. PDC80]|uniref:tetratricopeptide repeat protein n=1 Tax=Variovorax sp. PDC80 TaxID=1882827 RepID=UPI0008F25833|nr:tetratricopeptide repeat protein [Variovorax sp. PDC80]SFP04587.1 Flp pilus assembly protein TadD, contains TPR repeats [Variovorax sp. PDC80]
MKSIKALPLHWFTAYRVASLLIATVLLLAITGCAATKDRYAASEDAQQRQAFETTTEAKAATNIDTQTTYIKVVDQMQQQGLWFASLAHIDALEQRWGITPDSTRLRADALRQTGQGELAEATYKRLLGTPIEGAGYRGLGLLAGARGDYAEASRLLRQAQRRTPTDPLLLSDLGYAVLRAGQVEEARLPLMQALQLQPDNKQAQANVALYLEVTNQREQATALMDANRMPEATRTAVREAARQMRVVGNSTAAIAVAPAITPNGAPSVASEDAALPLALKPSRWFGMGGVRTASQLNPPAAAGDAPLSSNPTSRGTP